MSERQLTVLIYFYLSGKQYSLRRWPAVPRIGDEVMLWHKGSEAKRAFRVERVVWGVENEEQDRAQEQHCNIELKLMPQ